LRPDMVETNYVDAIREEYKKRNHYDTKEMGEGYVAGTIAATAMPGPMQPVCESNQTPFYPHRIIERREQIENKEKG
jgi:hypothetical protein